jgi:acetyltransferase-like isoleucine patch superfamily enzyme
MIEKVKFGSGTVVKGDDRLVNLYSCEFGINCTIAPFVEIQQGVRVGNYTKISSHTFICDGVEIGDYCFIGHGVMFTNDVYPTTVPRPDYKVKTKVCNDVSIGSGATILPVYIGNGAIIGAGAVVVHDIAAYSIVVGNPARVTQKFNSLEERNDFIKYHYSNRL